MQGRPFEGTVRRAHSIEPGHVVLILERYAGDIDVGDSIAVSYEGAVTQVRVSNLAWGSAFGKEDPPLTLVVVGLPPDGKFAGAKLASVASSK